MFITIVHLLQRKGIFIKNRTNNFGKHFVIKSAIDSWNRIQDQIGKIALKDLRPSKIKLVPPDKFIKSY